jgi:hypothetical protein
MTTLLRILAFLIALAGLLDPALTSTRRSRPLIAVLAADGRDSAQSESVARQLSADFTVVRAPLAGADAHVVVGTRLPEHAQQITGPAFVVLPGADGARVVLTDVRTPEHAPLDARVQLTAGVQVTGGAGRKLVVTLSLADLVVDRAEYSIDQEQTRLQVPLWFAPASAGGTVLRVTAQLEGARPSARADVLLDVREQRWSVLFFDRRPSWMSTFVRRALEQDPRFTVTSRVSTSRGIATAIGQSPATLDRMAALTSFDAIVIGAPEALRPEDVAGLEAYLRRGAGGVLLLFDRRTNGPVERLLQVTRWATAQPGAAVTLTGADDEQSVLLSTALAWPGRLPAGAQPVALYRSGDSASQVQPVIWRTAVGPGRLVVSGALDAWKYRAPGTSPFDEFWRTAIAELSDATAAELEIRTGSTVLAPGERTELQVTLRETALAEPVPGQTLRTSISATLETAAGRQPLRLWPDGPAGHFRGSLRAPASAGVHRIIVTAEGRHAERAIAVVPDAARARPDERDLLRAWAASRRGSVWQESQLKQMRNELARVLQPLPRRMTWHPMRSAWWLPVFTLVLGLEWWWRRRRGLA